MTNDHLTALLADFGRRRSCEPAAGLPLLPAAQEIPLLTFASLPVERQRLIALCREIEFGWIEQLAIVNGQPLLAPPTKLVRQVRLGGNYAPTTPIGDDFQLRRAQLDLLAHVDILSNGIIERLDIRAGLPFLLRFELTHEQLDGNRSSSAGGCGINSQFTCRGDTRE